MPCVKLLNEIHSSPGQGTSNFFNAVKKKYANEVLYAVSTFPGVTLLD